MPSRGTLPLGQFPKGLPCVSAPKLFPVAFNLVKSFMSEETRLKIMILGGECRGLLAVPISPSAQEAEVSAHVPVSLWLILFTQALTLA